MQLKKENLWTVSYYPCVIIITTNASLKSDASLAMGRRTALEAKSYE